MKAPALLSTETDGKESRWHHIHLLTHCGNLYVQFLKLCLNTRSYDTVFLIQSSICLCNLYSPAQWISSLRRGNVADRFPKLRVEIPQDANICGSFECFVFSGKDLCVRPDSFLEEFYRICFNITCDLETSRKGRPWPALGCWPEKRNGIYPY